MIAQLPAPPLGADHAVPRTAVALVAKIRGAVRDCLKFGSCRSTISKSPPVPQKAEIGWLSRLRRYPHGPEVTATA